MRKTKFKDNPSPLYRETLAYLQRLLEAEGLDSVRRAFADAAADATKREFQEVRDLDRETRGGARYIARFRFTGRGSDHVCGWSRNGSRAVLVSQPYHLGSQEIIELAQAHILHDLDIRISSDSYYFPGRSLMIELWKKSKSE
jgi:hypothetical protein